MAVETCRDNPEEKNRNTFNPSLAGMAVETRVAFVKVETWLSFNPSLAGMAVETRPAETLIIEASNLHLWQDYLKASPVENEKTKSVDTAFLQINTGQGF